MNIIETIYCSQYYELKKSGRDPMKGRLNGTLLSATVILLVVISVGVIIDHYSKGHFFKHVFRINLEHSYSARTIGRILGLVGIVVVGGILNFTYASKARYQKMIVDWEQLPEALLENAIKRSLKVFFAVFGAFLLVMILSFV